MAKAFINGQVGRFMRVNLKMIWNMGKEWLGMKMGRLLNYFGKMEKHKENYKILAVINKFKFLNSYPREKPQTIFIKTN